MRGYADAGFEGCACACMGRVAFVKILLMVSLWTACFAQTRVSPAQIRNQNQVNIWSGPYGGTRIDPRNQIASDTVKTLFTPCTDSSGWTCLLLVITPDIHANANYFLSYAPIFKNDHSGTILRFEHAPASQLLVWRQDPAWDQWLRQHGL
jgi:hypothetical protein